MQGQAMTWEFLKILLKIKNSIQKKEIQWRRKNDFCPQTDKNAVESDKSLSVELPVHDNHDTLSTLLIADIERVK